MSTKEDLSRLASDLNLADADDRAVFRIRVERLYRNARISAIHDAIKELAAADMPRERHHAARRLSDIFIAAHA